MDRKVPWLHFFTISFMGIVAYAGSIGGNFLLDDEIWIRPHGAVFISSFYRPLQTFIYALTKTVWGMNPAGYHLVSILFHILTALCIYRLVTLLFNDRNLSFLSAILFTVHPVETEAVSYISGLADPLSALFVIISLIFYIEGSYLSLAAFFLALLSKETALVLPLLLLLYHAVFKKRLSGKFIALTAISLIYITLRVTFCAHLAPLQGPGFHSGLSRIPGFFAAIKGYVKILFFPVNLHMEYGNKLFSFTDLNVIMGLILVALAAIFAFFRKGDKVILFSIGWFFLSLVPVSNIYKINAYMAEHFIYLPSIGFFILAAYFLVKIYENAKFRYFGAALAAFFVILCTVLTMQQNRYWSDPAIFFDRTIKLSPGSATAYYGRGFLNDKAGRYNEAIVDYSAAISLKPDFADAYNNRGIVYEKKRKSSQAMSDYNKALELAPGNVAASANLKRLKN